MAAQGTDPQSLFPPGSSGWFAGRSGWKPGDIILLDLNSKISLTLKSARTAGRLTSLELGSNAEESPLSRFPPASADSDFQLDANVERGFQGRLALRITSVDSDGTLLVLGNRRLNLAGGLEEVTVEGRAHPSHIQAGVITLENLADLSLTMRVPAQGGSGTSGDAADPQTALDRYWNQFRDALSSTYE